MSRHERDEARTALANLLRGLGAPDPDAIALEVITMLTARGWRPTTARPPVDWRTTQSPADETAVHRHAEEARAAIRAAREGSTT